MANSDLPVFLKAINIQGFKSFADKVTLELLHGLSVVVGPNGSGKSNIADAVRWVLGEQSAKSLRGNKMEDVIFSGSSSRRAVGTAEVSLVFDNAEGIFPLEYNEVTIARRVYRDGEGQYFINRVPCRLKDIQELLMDTGAGKEGFSIIGQGRVDEILNLRSEERRTLIEEAAGITKYRMRKKEAVKRLDETEQNLTRIEDILGEIEGRLGPLAQQAELAQRSVTLNEELEKLEIQLIVRDLNEVKQKLAELSMGMASQKEALAVKLKELGQMEHDYAQQQLQLTTLNETIQSQQQKVYELEQAQNTKQHELVLRQERKKHLEEQIKRLHQEVQLESERLNFLTKRIESVEGKQAILRETVERGRKQLHLSEEELRRAREQRDVEEIERLKGDVFQALSERASITNTLASLQQNLISMASRHKQLESEREIVFLEWKQNEKKRAEQQETAKLCETREDDLLHSLRRKQEKRRETEAELQNYEDQHKNVMRKMDALQARFNALQAMEESLEGYGQGVREVLKAKKRGNKQCSGVCGTVAEVIKTDKEYELALETALGAGLQNLITNTETDAKASISYLKENRLGRVTFLPLNTIRPSRIEPAHYQQIKGFLGLASDLTECEAKFKPAVEFLLGRTLVADNLDTATKIARAGDYKVRVVTLEGDLINSGGSMTGGSIKNRGGGLLGRTRELEELSAELKEKENELLARGSEIEVLGRRLQEMETQRKSLETELVDLREKRAVLTVNLENLQTQTRKLAERISYLDLEVDRTETEEQELKKTLEVQTRQLQEKELEVENLTQNLKLYEEKAEIAAGIMEQLSERITKEKVQLAKWEEEYSQTAELLLREKESGSDKTKELEYKNRELEKLKKAVAEILAETTHYQDGLNTGQENLDHHRQTLIYLRQEREKLSSQVGIKEEELKDTRRLAQEFEQKIHISELKAARWEAEWDTGCQRLKEEFGLTWEDALDFLAETERSTLIQRLQVLKQAIGDLGPVNHAALEEYPKLEKRHTFLTTQRDDLVKAHLSLRNLIAELDQTMNERFKAGFEAVNAAFRQVFAELFQGGQAELKLSTPDDLLETGIEIIAQPPGKKPQLLSLLSGGERALTAIAILFALLHVKPSPFCILDEIEAALDESNVQRFASYIHKLSRRTQFVVISHRRGTMEAADALYGVTMEESGVSKLLTVKFNEKLSEPETA